MNENANIEATEVKLKVTAETIQKAEATLMRYKEGKVNLDNRIVSNEQWYKLRHWQEIQQMSRKKTESESNVEPVSAWLFNVLVNKSADAMDNMPTPRVRARYEQDVEEAKKLSSILPAIMKANRFETVYDEEQDSKFKYGTGVYGVFWDKDKMNGLGDIEVVRCDVLNLYWEPGVSNIQKSPNFFSVSAEDNDTLVSQYPQLNGKLGMSTNQPAEYIHDENIDMTDKSVVVDWYYKRFQNGKMVLHYCKFCNGEILYATENDPNGQDGIYQHGKYPFVFDRLYRMENSPCGLSIIDIGKNPQMFIDLIDQAIMENTLATARPRYAIREDGQLNEEEFADQTKHLVHFKGDLELNRNLIPLSGIPLATNVLNVLQSKVDEMKETTGNRDVSTGGTTSGVTAASALAAMQEAGAKLSRYSNWQSHNAAGEVFEMVRDLYMQFAEMPRPFTYVDEQGAEQFTMYDNSGLQMEQYEGIDGKPAFRMPIFDIEVTATKKSPYSRMAQNELALQLYGAGFFTPANADQSMIALDMMDFEGKEMLMQKLQKNATLLQVVNTLIPLAMQMAQQLDSMAGIPAMQEQLMPVIQMVEHMGMAMPEAAAKPDLGNLGGMEEPANVQQARQRVAQSTAP